MDVELRHLRYFVAVAEELHFGRAARRLQMAQPPLSQAIRQLEEIVGCELLSRNSRAVQLTAAGGAFLDRARRTLHNVARDVHEARSIGRGETGVLNVGYVGSVMMTVLPDILSEHLGEFPGVQLRLHESFTSRVVEGLLDGSVDAGVVRDAEPTPGLKASHLLSEPFIAIVPVAHPSAAAPSTSVSALEGDPFISPPRSAGPRAYEKPLSLCEEHGFRPFVAHEATHWLTITRLVGAGLGVTIAPACVRTIATPDVRCLELPESQLRSEVALMHRDGESRPIVSAFERIAKGRATAHRGVTP